MAKLFLAENESFTLIDGPDVFGASGNEKIGISGAAGATIDQGVERVEFSDVLANYSLSLTGNILVVKLNGVIAANITVQGDGTKLAFKDGSADIILTGLSNGTLGGGTVNGTDSVITGATLDGFDTSSVGVIGGSSSKVVNISATGVDNFGADSQEDASAEDIGFNFTQGSYTYTIDGFAAGDTLQFETGVALSVTNSAVDGQVQINASNSSTGTTVQLVLTGIATALDSTIIDVNSFNNAFGSDSLA